MFYSLRSLSKCFLLGLFILAIGNLYANPKADSLVNELSKHDETIEKADLLIDICGSYIRSDVQSAISYGNYALSLSKKLGYAKGRGKANFRLSYVYYNYGYI